MRALVFDLDGTLLQLERPYRSVLKGSFEAVCGRVEAAWLDIYTDVFADVFASHEPTPAQRAFEATDAPGDPSEFADQLLEAEVAATALPEHARPDLASLGDQFSLGVLTNGPSEWQRAKLAGHSLSSYFDVVVTSYDVGAHKPDPEPYRAVESQLDVTAYAMVGDSDSDIEGATTAGWRSVRYTDQRLADIPETLTWA